MDQDSSIPECRDTPLLIAGRLLDSTHAEPSPGWIRIEDGRIADLGAGLPPAAPDLGGDDALLSPGFIDAHVHLPQMPWRGCGGHDLLDWLDRVVYPAETAWSDPNVAVHAATAALADMVHAGTLGAAAFLSSHPHAADAVRTAHGVWPIHLRAGVALMDREAPTALLTGTAPLPPPAGRSLIAPDHGCGDRLQFTVNPRFAISCTPELLRAAVAAAADGLTVHTHIAEQQCECRRVRELFPEADHYAGVYDAFGLLKPGTLLAHGVHLAAEEWDLLAARQAVVVHCPGANTFLGSGAFDLAAARQSGVTVALGSDVAAGPDVAMPRVARSMIEVARLRRAFDTGAIIPSPLDAWSMITRVNADALGMRTAGRLEIGAEADILVLRVPFAIDTHIYGRLIHTWDDAFIAARIIAGSIIPDEPSPRC